MSIEPLHPPDSLPPVVRAKLDEMAYHWGAVLLDIGIHVSSATVLLQAAVRASEQADRPRPQLYGLARQASSIQECHQALQRVGLADYAVFYHGELERFRRDIPIAPSLVVHGADPDYASAWADLHLLNTFLAPGTPVLCSNAGEGVRRAAQEWTEAGCFELFGEFGPALLLRASSRCRGRVQGLDPDRFARLGAMLLAHYRAVADAPNARPASVHGLTRLARAAQLATRLDAGCSGHGAWPYAAPETPPLPPTLPDGRPWPRISIVTPSFSQGRYLRETLLSVLNQHYPNVEHIIIDGGSTDETAAILAAYRPRLAYVVSERDRGQSHALNKGFARATGDILTWLNSDDLLAPGALAAAALAFHTSGADLVAGICQLFRDGAPGEQHLTSCVDGPLPVEELLDLEACWAGGQFFYQPEVLFRRSLWQAAGARVDESLYYSMDYELWLRFAEQGARLHVIGRPLAWYRQHPEQKTYVAERFQAELRSVRDAFARRTGRSAPPPRRVGQTRSLRVTVFNDLGFQYGAGTAHQRLAQAVAVAGHDVQPIGVMAEINRFTAPVVTDEAILDGIANSKPDLILMGNVHSASLPPSTVAQIAERWPTLFVMHDLWMLTGRCAYMGDCTKHLAGCDHACPTSDEHPRLEPKRIFEAWTARRRMLTGAHPPFLLTDSEWVLSEARKAFPGGCDASGLERRVPPMAAIRYGFPLDVFRPRDQQLCRELLGLPADRFILLTSASTVTDPRKGIAHLAQALQQLQLPDLLVVALGRVDPGRAPPIPEMRALGYLTDPQRLAILYSAVDLFVGPSLEEAFGQVFIEAAACGTPSVGYPVGGIPEALVDGVTGRLAARVAPAALAEAIEELYGQPEYRRQLGRWARLYVENEFSLASAYHRWFTVLAQMGLRERLGLAPKITLRSQPPALSPVTYVDPSVPRWRALDGFGPWENTGPYKPLIRHALGPVSRFEIIAERPGRHCLLITCRNSHPDQRLRLVHAGHVVAETEVPVDDTLHGCTLHFELDLISGLNALEMHHWRWDHAAPQQQTALIVLAIEHACLATAPYTRSSDLFQRVSVPADAPAGQVA
jgi:glycosyltransferase involved in cell wall biosynthesis